MKQIERINRVMLEMLPAFALYVPPEPEIRAAFRAKIARLYRAHRQPETALFYLAVTASDFETICRQPGTPPDAPAVFLFNYVPPEVHKSED